MVGRSAFPGIPGGSNALPVSPLIPGSESAEIGVICGSSPLFCSRGSRIWRLNRGSQFSSVFANGTVGSYASREDAKIAAFGRNPNHHGRKNRKRAKKGKNRGSSHDYLFCVSLRSFRHSFPSSRSSVPSWRSLRLGERNRFGAAAGGRAGAFAYFAA